MLVGVVMLAGLGCGDEQAQTQSSTPSQSGQPAPTPKPAPAATSSQLSWAEVLEQNPDPKVVTDADFLKRIKATGLPWRVTHKSAGIEMLLVPPGTFMMGASPGDTQASDDEKPAHEVTITKAFYLGRTEVTQAQWFKVMDTNPSKFRGESLPVDSVSWNDISVFLKKTSGGLQLPTEAEWEYAYRAGTTTAFHSYAAQPNGFNDDTLLSNIAWINSNSGNQTHAVGGKFANGLGLHDMAGNVWEWCQDWYGPYSSGSVTNPTGPTTGTYRLLRGGYWYSYSYSCRASRRYLSTPGTVYSYIGFRVVRTP
jgi:formylglycine-generating enzyme required for sulfatase activity